MAQIKEHLQKTTTNCVSIDSVPSSYVSSQIMVNIKWFKLPVNTPFDS